MISKLLKDKISDIMDIIEALRPDRNRLVELYQAYSHPISFINKYLRDFPTSSREWAGAIYRAIRYFARQDEYLPLQGAGTDLDMRLAGQIPLPFDKPGLAYGYRYNIRVDIDAPGIDQRNTFNFWYDSTGLLSELDVLEGIMPALIKLSDRYKLTFVEGFTNSATITSSQLMDFVQYIPDLNRG